MKIHTSLPVCDTSSGADCPFFILQLLDSEHDGTLTVWRMTHHILNRTERYMDTIPFGLNACRPFGQALYAS
jgi:hypothetical protein